MKVNINKAGNGDCLLIQSGETSVLVDGGTATSYKSWEKIVTSKSKLDCLIITHIDNDHVNGIIKLLENTDLETFSIEQVIYNGAPQIMGLKYSTDDKDYDQNYEMIASQYEEVTEDTDVASSEGTSLSYLIERLQLNVNPNAINTSNTTTFSIGELTFELISPDIETLEELKNHWLKTLNDDGISPKIISKSHANAFENYIDGLKEDYLEEITDYNENSVEALAEFDYKKDKSLANKSSFAFLVKSNTSKLLMLGDCHAETLLKWLNNKKINTIYVDAVKLSHHGSKKNINSELIKRVRTENFIISTNGKSHNHPDLETLALIAKKSESNLKKIYINYSISHIPKAFLEELESYSTYVYMNKCELEL
ncbi:ComEC/Rec2 family competence protein [Photobacterium leiognathi]|uniref:ComEC/Rec2 family competence protein n=1 Tax=Photobacterium leiognathi TaxID=553611 RepID=UPI002980E9DD|nr:MBL fold metallo-hydrolase [Photobacterium leiognathi]